jgi:hypothetical protein
MPMRVTCICGKSYAVGDEHAGKTMRCRACRGPIAVPMPDVGKIVDVSTPPAPVEPPRVPAGRSIRPRSAVLVALATAAVIGPIGLMVGARIARREAQSATATEAPLSDEEGDRLIDQALKRYVAAAEQLKTDLSDESRALARRRQAEFHAAIDRASARYCGLLDEAARYFPDPSRDIYLHAVGAKEMLRDKGIRADTGEILRGGIFLLKNSHYPRPNTQAFGSFTYQYQRWREDDGLSHDEAIRKMHELRKF